MWGTPTTERQHLKTGEARGQVLHKHHGKSLLMRHPRYTHRGSSLGVLWFPSQPYISMQANKGLEGQGSYHAMSHCQGPVDVRMHQVLRPGHRSHLLQHTAHRPNLARMCMKGGDGRDIKQHSRSVEVSLSLAKWLLSSYCSG